ncbi:MAG TPA: hypothetical protein VM509_13895, partial [Planctomycetota bacterium]|nr:hypothetical protein [Planctomycetota bacterium]
MAILCSLLGLAALDVGLGRFALDDGEFLGRPVPPYGDVREERWQAWARHRAEWLRAGRESSQASVHDALLGWTNARNFRSPDGTQTFDSRGLRGAREFTELPAEGKLRVALFGESFVLGEEVADDEAFAARLEALEPRFEVMNFGVSGYGTDQ